MKHGFTLVELAIVLVIIGLIVGGVLVGQSLIETATVRAAIGQIEKFDTAVNTFRNKYNGLPGDLKNGDSFGFVARTGTAGGGDGNGIIQGIYSNGMPYGGMQGRGETVVLWRDLSDAGLIAQRFATADNANLPGANQTTDAGIGSYLPQSKLGSGSYIFVVNYDNTMIANAGPADNKHYWALSGISALTTQGVVNGTRMLKVAQAYNIDAKMDDALPQSGIVTAKYIPDGALYWVGATGTGATSGSASTCYDNANTASATQQYSMAQTNGDGTNCALVIRASF